MPGPRFSIMDVTEALSREIPEAVTPIVEKKGAFGVVSGVTKEPNYAALGDRTVGAHIDEAGTVHLLGGTISTPDLPTDLHTKRLGPGVQLMSNPRDLQDQFDFLKTQSKVDDIQHSFYQVTGDFFRGRDSLGSAQYGVNLKRPTPLGVADPYDVYSGNAEEWLKSPFVTGLANRMAEERVLNLQDAIARGDEGAIQQFNALRTNVSQNAPPGTKPTDLDRISWEALQDWQRSSVRDELAHAHMARAAQADGFDGMYTDEGKILIYPNEPVDLQKEVASIRAKKWAPWAMGSVALTTAGAAPFTSEAQAAENRGSILESTLQSDPGFAHLSPGAQAEVRASPEYFDDTKPLIRESDLWGDPKFRAKSPAVQDQIRKGLGSSYLYDAPLDPELRPGWFGTAAQNLLGTALHEAGSMLKMGVSQELTGHVQDIEKWKGFVANPPPQLQGLNIEIPDIDGKVVKISRTNIFSEGTSLFQHPYLDNADLRAFLHMSDFELTEDKSWEQVDKEMQDRALEAQQAVGAPTSAIIIGKVAGSIAATLPAYMLAAEALPMKSYEQLRTGMGVLRATLGYAGRQTILGAAAEAPLALRRVAAGVETPGQGATDVGLSGAFAGALGLGAPGAKMLKDSYDILTAYELKGGMDGMLAASKKYAAREELPQTLADFLDSLNGRLQRRWWTSEIEKDAAFRQSTIGRYIYNSINEPDGAFAVPADLGLGERTRRWFQPPKQWAGEIQARYPGIPLRTHIQAVDDAVQASRQYVAVKAPELEGLLRRLDSAAADVKGLPDDAPSARENALQAFLAKGPARPEALRALEARAPGSSRTSFDVKEFERPSLPGVESTPLGGAEHPIPAGASPRPDVALARRSELQQTSWLDDFKSYIMDVASNYRLPGGFLRTRQGSANLKREELAKYFNTWLPLFTRLPKYVAMHPDKALKSGEISKADYLLIQNFGKEPRLKQFHNDLIMNGLNPSNIDDIGKLGRAVLRTATQARWVKPKLDAMRRTFIDTTPGGPARDMQGNYKFPDAVRKSAEDFIANVSHTPSGYTGEVQAWFKSLYKGLGIEPSDARVSDLADMYITAHYGSLMAFRPGVALRQFMQIPSTVYPLLGARFTAEGTKRMATKGSLAELQNAGVTIEDFLPYLAESIGAAGEHSVASGLRGKLIGRPILAAERAMVKLTEIGLKPTHYADTVVRGISYFGAQARAEWAHDTMIKAMKDAGLSIGRDMPTREIADKFFSNSGLRYMDPSDQKWALQTLFRTPQDITNKAEDVIRRIAFRFQEDTNWIYRAGHRPPIISENSPLGVFAKAIGQFGVWSANYAFYMRGLARLAMRDPSAGASAISRWVVGNTATKVAAASLFGVDASNWLFFSPLSYSGGPAVQDAIALLNSNISEWVTGGDKAGPEAGIYRSRLTRANPLRALIPGTKAYDDVASAIELWGKEDPDGLRDAISRGTLMRSIVRFFSFPVIKPQPPSLMTPEGQQWLRQRMDRLRQKYGQPEGAPPPS